MTADAVAVLVGPHHHDHRVPADRVAELQLQRLVAGVLGLGIHINGVDVRRVLLELNRRALEIGVVIEFGQQFRRAVVARVGKHVGQRIQPLLRLHAVD